METQPTKKELTLREKELLKYLYFPIPEIAKRMGISENTVKTFKTILRYKLETVNDAQIVIQALKKGLIKLDDIRTEL